jgi:hypothetical protein
MYFRNLMNIRHLRHLMSSNITANNSSEPQTVNWMLEDFPADVKQKCKEQAVLQRQTLKAFVESVLRGAVARLELEPNRSLGEKIPSSGSAKPASKSRDRGNSKTKPRAS